MWCEKSEKKWWKKKLETNINSNEFILRRLVATLGLVVLWAHVSDWWEIGFAFFLFFARFLYSFCGNEKRNVGFSALIIFVKNHF